MPRSPCMKTRDIPIPTPCGADWTAMKPGDRMRFCDACKKHVHDLSAMKEDEARRVLASPPLEGLCVRFLYDRHGDLVFRREAIPSGALVRAKRAALYALAAALPLSLTACMGAPVMPPPMMGAVACPMPTVPAPAGSSEEPKTEPAPRAPSR